MEFTPIVGSLTLSLGGYEIAALPYALILVTTTFAVLPAILFRKWYASRRRLQINLITSEFDPPAKLTPAEVQYLFGGINKQRITAATIIHMVQRGLLHMRKVDNKKMLYVGPRVSDKLLSWERMLISRIESEHGIDPNKVLDNPIAFVDKEIDDSHTEASTLSDYIGESLQNRGLIKGKGVNSFFLDALKGMFVLLLFLVWWPVGLYWFMFLIESSASDFSSVQDFTTASAIITLALSIPLYVFSVFFVKWRAQLLGRRWMSTDRLTRLWPQIIGFRSFVKLTEKNSLKFDSEELQKSSSKDILSYAVALGFVENWREIVT